MAASLVAPHRMRTPPCSFWFDDIRIGKVVFQGTPSVVKIACLPRFGARTVQMSGFAEHCDFLLDGRNRGREGILGNAYVPLAGGNGSTCSIPPGVLPKARGLFWRNVRRRLSAGPGCLACVCPGADCVAPASPLAGNRHSTPCANMELTLCMFRASLYCQMLCIRNWDWQPHDALPPPTSTPVQPLPHITFAPEGPM